MTNLYLKDQINEIFWLGAIIVIVVIFACFKLMLKIEDHLKKLGEA